MRLRLRPAWMAGVILSAVVGAARALSDARLATAAVAGPQRGLSDSMSVNKFMWYFPATRTVHVALDAALGGNNGGMNFNGKSSGAATIIVPAGWKVRMHFLNLDAIPHSAIVIANQQPLPMIPQTAAFGGAYTRDLTAGLFTDQSDDLNFNADPSAKYVLVCGVPGHGPSGMWIWFIVSPDAKVPAYEM